MGIKLRLIQWARRVHFVRSPLVQGPVKKRSSGRGDDPVRKSGFLNRRIPQTHRARFSCASPFFKPIPRHRVLLGELVKRLGHTCLVFDDGLALSKALSRSTVDMLMLDWHCTACRGLDLLNSVRSSFGERVPVLFVSADGAEHNIVRALSAGADDFLVHAGARRRIRRAGRGAAAARVSGADLRDLRCRPAIISTRSPADGHVRGKPVPLRARNSGSRSLFFSNVGRVLSRDHIFAMVWGREFREFDAYDRQPRVAPAAALEIEPVKTIPAAARLQERLSAASPVR